MPLRIVVGIIGVCLVAPLFVIFPLSFSSVSFFEFPPPGYSLQWYQEFLEKGQWLQAFFRSIQIAILTSILSIVIGTMAAYGVARLTFRGKGLLMGMMISPMIVPVIVLGVALYDYFSMFQLTGSILGLVIAHSLVTIPIAFVTILTSLNGMDRNLELAALSLGSTPVGVFFKITLPIIKPGIISSAIFSFIISFDEVVLSIFVSGPATKTLPVLIWENLRSEVNPTIAAVSAILIAMTVLLFLAQDLFAARANKMKKIQQ